MPVRLTWPRWRWWHIVAGLVGVPALMIPVSLALLSRAGVVSGRFALEYVSLEDRWAVRVPEPCAERRRDPREAGPWRRQWRLDGDVTVWDGTWRGVPVGNDRALVLWRDLGRYESTVPSTIEGDWLGERGEAHFFASTQRLGFGFGFELMDGDASRICRLNLTFPMATGNSTYGLPLARPLRWTALAIGDEDRAQTITREHRVTMTRLDRARWRFEVEPLGTPPARALWDARVDIRTDGSKPPWDRIELDVEAKAVALRPPGTSRHS